MFSRKGSITVVSQSPKYASEGCHKKLNFYRKKSKGEVYSEPCQASKMERFANIVNGFQLLTFSQKSPS